MTEKCEGCGGHGWNCAPDNSTPDITKNLSHPVLCQKCTGEYNWVEEGPDAGVRFACGIMIENIEAGNMWFACPYFVYSAKKDQLAPVIDAEKAQRNALTRGRFSVKGFTCFLCGRVLRLGEKTSHGSCMRCWMEAHT